MTRPGSGTHFPFVEFCPGFESENAFGRARAAENELRVLRALVGALPPRQVAELAVRLAEETDRRVATLPDTPALSIS